MQGQIVSYRRSKHDQTTNQVIVVVDSVKDKEAAQKLVGKSVSWKSIKAELTGTIATAHGNKGALRVRFERGLPGQAIGSQVQIQ